MRRFLRASEALEKRFLRRTTLKVFGGLAAILIALFVFAAFLGSSRLYILAAIFGLIFCPGLLWTYRDLYRTESKALRGFAKARQSNSMRAMHVVASEVIVLQGVEGRNHTFAFQMADSRIIFVEGYEASAKFPNDNFTHWRLLDDNGVELTCCIEKHGSRLRPSRAISGLVMQGAQWRPEHLQIITGSLADLETMLRTPSAPA
ncbi:MAG TPA: hypothetical protein VMF58_16250 [Rhizomicrobium sp.]|nr:hypothetical protein [Rhizomicrobium sp.]